MTTTTAGCSRGRRRSTSSAQLPDWPLIERELADLPASRAGDDFETWVVSLMGRRLYELFIEGYTRKQWGCEPSELSSRFAPKRVDLRDDGYTRLFRDTWEFFPERGASAIIEAILQPVPVTCGVEVGVDDIDDVAPDADVVVVTAPLDDFLGRPGTLAWRGIHMVSRYVPTATEDGTRDTGLRGEPPERSGPVHPHRRDQARSPASASQAPW